ncbi:MAG: AAA family ATPase [Clostridia bacterium]|nr:AAA family ATPase [Clostridia bacterium]
MSRNSFEFVVRRKRGFWARIGRFFKGLCFWKKRKAVKTMISDPPFGEVPIENPRHRIDRLLSLDLEDLHNHERNRYRDCLIQIADMGRLKEEKMEIVDEETGVHKIRVNDNTVLLDVDQPGEYMCIYEYSLREEGPASGKMLCIADAEQYQYFTDVKDLQKRVEDIAYYSKCSPEQRRHIVGKIQQDAIDEDDQVSGRRVQRDIITNPRALEMMFRLCKHTLPVNVQYQCTELIRKIEHGRGGDNAAILTDILYTCGENGPHRPFLSTEECMEVFRRRRYGDDPWIKDIVRQIRLLNRCDHSGAVFVLVGPPGTGKTEVAEAIAECTHKKFCVVNCRNKNGMEIGGSHRTYTDSCHGEIQDNLLYYGNDCCMLLDEFEKMVVTEKEGNPFALFISTWDDRKTFTDAFTGVPVPTKDVIWILTVNSIDKVPDYILNRFQENIFMLDSYTAQTKAEISKRFIVPKYMKTYNFSEQEVRFTDEGLVAIAKTTSDAGARVTAQKIEKVLRAANEKLEEGAAAPIVVDSKFALSALKDTAQCIGETHRPIGF